MGSRSRSLLLTSFAAIYVAAFVSLWLQFPGTLGDDGLLPVGTFWSGVSMSRQASTTPIVVDVPLLGGVTVASGKFAAACRNFLKFPCALWFADLLGLKPDVFYESTVVLGFICGFLGLAGIQHAFVYLTAYLCYLTCFLAGQKWLGFQWDIFLLETGASLVLYAPWWSLRASGPQPCVAWLLRAQWVKFMLMSGIVKVTASCPTWKHLTALEYHFASTCLPTAEAWMFHSLPPTLLRLGVAFMFLLEVVAPWLLVVPARPVRQVGVIVQVPLQVGIMLTGNYNWFNLHTTALLLAAWDDDVCLESPPLRPLRLLLAPIRVWEAIWRSTPGSAAGATASVLLLLGSAFYLFPISYHLPQEVASIGADVYLDGLRIENRITEPFVREMLDTMLHRTSYSALFAFSGLFGLVHAVSSGGGFIRRFASCVWRLLLACVALSMLGVTLLPMRAIHRDPAIPFREKLRHLQEVLEPFHVSNSYGLFRRMTGVGKAPPGAAPWGGLPPAVVEVPAVVVEARTEGGPWREIPFRYAPYRPERPPRRTAPHQPRLDWQMWFAALGSYQHNPWFVHLIWKILIGSKDTLDLLDGTTYPFPRDPPSYVRASLYYYDFTRLASPWASRLEKAGLAKILNLTNGSTERNLWWSRKRVREYFPEVSQAMLLSAAKEQGWPIEPVTKSTLGLVKACSEPRQLIREAKGLPAWLGAKFLARLCEGTMLLRVHGLPLRRFVGVQTSCAVFAWFWPGASTTCFLDGPLLIILAAAVIPLTVGISVAIAWALVLSMFRRTLRQRTAVRESKKKLD